MGLYIGLRVGAALLALLLAPLCSGSPARSQGAAPEARTSRPPACTGRDLYALLASEEPELRQRIDATAAATPHAGALLWRLERAGAPVSHLYGTVHLSDDRVHALSEPTRQAMAAAEQIVLEVADLSPVALAGAVGRLQELLVQVEGRPLSEELSPAHAATARRALERAGMPGGALEVLRPWVVTMALALTDCERRRSAAGLKALDAAIADSGRRRGAPVLGLESLDDQLKALAAVPAADQLEMLRATLELEPLKDDLTETLVRLYLARRLGHIWPLQVELWRRAGFEPAALAAFHRELVDKRNRAMAVAAERLMAAQASFVAVGALHLPGEEGLVALLRRAGWTVTAVE